MKKKYVMITGVAIMLIFIFHKYTAQFKQELYSFLKARYGESLYPQSFFRLLIPTMEHSRK